MIQGVAIVAFVGVVVGFILGIWTPRRRSCPGTLGNRVAERDSPKTFQNQLPGYAPGLMAIDRNTVAVVLEKFDWQKRVNWIYTDYWRDPQGEPDHLYTTSGAIRMLVLRLGTANETAGSPNLPPDGQK